MFNDTTTATEAESTETGAAAVLARQAAEPTELDRAGVIYATVGPDGHHEILNTDQYALTPWRVGPRNVDVYDAPSFLAYLDRYAAAEHQNIEVWSNVDRKTVTAVLNASQGHKTPDWGDHRVVLHLRADKQWETWIKASGALGRQTVFAEFIDDNQDDFVDPNSATMLDLARSFTAKKNVEFESSENLANGARGLVYHETIAARAGEKGELEIPTSVTIGLRPFQGADIYKVQARLRYRITDGTLQIGFKLHRPDTIMDDAFDSVLADIAAGLPDTVRVNNGIG